MPTLRAISHAPYEHLSRLDDGRRSVVYADDAAREGYQLVPAAEAATLAVGDVVDVGTGYDYVDLDDPRPECFAAPGCILSGGGRKPVGSTWRRIVEIGPPRPMLRRLEAPERHERVDVCRIVLA